MDPHSWQGGSKRDIMSHDRDKSEQCFGHCQNHLSKNKISDVEKTKNLNILKCATVRLKTL